MSDENQKSETTKDAPPVDANGDGFVMLLEPAERALETSRNSVVQLRNRTRAAAAPALEKAKITLRLGASRGATGIKSIYGERLRPAAKQSGKWLRRRFNPATLLRDYRRALLLAHSFGPDRAVERFCFIETSRHVPLSIVRVPHQLRRTGHDYRPTPRRVFEWAMQMIPESVERFEFVDYGAGRGRVLLMSSHHPFEKIRGAEIAEEFHRECLLNVAQYPRSLMKCRDVDCQHLSALRFEVPEQQTVFYMHNPFDRSMLERVLAQIVRAYKQEPRRFYVICVDMNDPEIFEETGIFEKIVAPWKLRLKIAALSPYSIDVYRTVY